ncbi:hypothetical protein RB595_009600 [Gaeumannomyces hyphopodioides]
MAAPQSQPGPFAITKGKLIIIASLIFTWWIAFLLPHYTPAIQAGIQSRLDEARKKLPAIKLDWKPAANPRAHYNASKIALIVEHRPIPHLVPQILHMIGVIPPDWRMVFVGSERSTVSISRSVAIKHQQVIGKMDILVLPEPWQIDSKEMIHRLMTDIRFYDEFLPGVEWILRFESDSILCSNSETSLNEWLAWSWAGAPRSVEDRFSGNGGLSLRKVSAIRRVLGFQARFNDTEPEDEWFGKRLWILPGEKVASGVDGALALEDVYVENPMGFHIRDGGKDLKDAIWKNKEQRKKLFNYCPELALIMDMKLERQRCKGDNGESNLSQAQLDAAKRREDDEKRKHEEGERRKQEEKENKKKQEEEQRKAAEAKKAADDKKAEEKKKAEQQQSQ